MEIRLNIRYRKMSNEIYSLKGENGAKMSLKECKDMIEEITQNFTDIYNNHNKSRFLKFVDYNNSSEGTLTIINCLDITSLSFRIIEDEVY